jgi:YbbR domain-containing protein
MNLGEIVRHNLGLKAMSLLLAFMLWLFVAAGREAEISRSVPVLIENIPPGLVVAGNPPSIINVRIKGPRILLFKSRTERFSILLDLKGSKEGITSFPSPGALINLPDGVRVTRVAPASIEVRLAIAVNKGKGNN